MAWAAFNCVAPALLLGYAAGARGAALRWGARGAAAAMAAALAAALLLAALLLPPRYDYGRVRACLCCSFSETRLQRHAHGRFHIIRMPLACEEAASCYGGADAAENDNTGMWDMLQQAPSGAQWSARLSHRC